MKIYAVGGSVRDELMGREPHDKDYVVVGSTPEEMLSLGYKQVGNDFPVFLHPETHEEYALARKEVSTGKGYDDFKFDFNPNITLREDLERRDFTVNAIAKDTETGEIIDYFGGQKDIENRMLQAVNPKYFVDDPLRLIRGCRFAQQLNFKLTSNTVDLCRHMVREGMIEHLTEERVWKEIEKALYYPNFHVFLYWLDEVNALKIILPEVYELKSIPENTFWHPEGNVYAHTVMALARASQYVYGGTSDALINFGVLCHDLGKQLTPKDKLPSHHGHDDVGGEIVERLCARLKVPNVYRDFGKLCCKQHMRFYKFLDMKRKNQYDMINEITKFKDKLTLHLLQYVHLCDLHGKERPATTEEVEYSVKTIDLQNVIFDIMEGVGLDSLPEETQKHLSKFTGKEFGKLYRDAKISYLKHELGKWNLKKTQQDLN